MKTISKTKKITSQKKAVLHILAMPFLIGLLTSFVNSHYSIMNALIYLILIISYFLTKRLSKKTQESKEDLRSILLLLGKTIVFTIVLLIVLFLLIIK